MPTRYVVEHAKSGRASCRKCKEKILKGAVRVGAISDVGDYEMTRWFHVGCMNYKRAKPKIDLDNFESVLEGIDGLESDAARDERGRCGCWRSQEPAKRQKKEVLVRRRLARC